MKNIKAILIIFIIYWSSSSCSSADPVIGCTDPSAVNFDANAEQNCSSCCKYPPKQGGVLFWSEDPFAISTCGTFNITISNGKTTIIKGYYNNPGPLNCVNIIGGYVLLDVGTYQYTVTRSLGCPGGGGTITVNEGCNLFKLD